METTELGGSDAARTVQNCLEQFSRNNDGSVTFSCWPLDNELIDVYSEAGHPNWDGVGSTAISPSTILLTRRCIAVLPRKYQAPEISPEPDGHMNLEWYVSKKEAPLSEHQP